MGTNYHIQFINDFIKTQKHRKYFIMISRKKFLNFALLFTLTIFETFSMDDTKDNSLLKFVSEGSIPVVSPSEFPRPNHLSPKKWQEMEIGFAIIQDRLKHKRQILAALTDETTSLENKLQLCLTDFGDSPSFKNGSALPHLNDLEIQPQDVSRQGIEVYCHYVSSMVCTYELIESWAKKLCESQTPEEKKTAQNNLYYILSCESKHFRECARSIYTHDIPEHSLEDNFYNMICGKMCGDATKEYDIVNEYLNVSFTRLGAKKTIDDKILLQTYRDEHNSLIQSFNKQQNPILWLASVKTGNNKTDESLHKPVNAQLVLIRKGMEECSKQTLATCELLSNRLCQFNSENELDKGNDIISVYNICGPWLLEAIHSYEAVTLRIKEIEQESIAFLKNYKTHKLFRKFPADVKTQTNNYLQDQEAKRKEEHQRQMAEKRAIEQEQERAKKKRQEAKIAKQQLKQEAKKKERIAAQKEAQLAGFLQVDSSPQETLVVDLPKVDSPLASPRFRKQTSLEQLVIPKVKVKTRPDRSPESDEGISPKKKDAEHDTLTFMLPEHCSILKFNSLIEEMLGETKDGKLKKLFSQLNAYGINCETGEQNNKGYFAIRSPITGRMHVTTYHHLHVAHPYASIFMALRDVLIAADIIERGTAGKDTKAIEYSSN